MSHPYNREENLGEDWEEDDGIDEVGEYFAKVSVSFVILTFGEVLMFVFSVLLKREYLRNVF